MRNCTSLVNSSKSFHFIYWLPLPDSIIALSPTRSAQLLPPSWWPEASTRGSKNAMMADAPMCPLICVSCMPIKRNFGRSWMPFFLFCTLARMASPQTPQSLFRSSPLRCSLQDYPGPATNEPFSVVSCSFLRKRPKHFNAEIVWQSNRNGDISSHPWH